MKDNEGFCTAFGHLEPDFYSCLLYEPGLDTVLYRFLFALTILIFVFPQYLSDIPKTNVF